MLFDKLKNNFLIPENEIILNKAFRARGIHTVLASVTWRSGKQILWLLFHYPRPVIWNERPETTTFRDIFTRQTESCPRIYPFELLLRGHKIRFGSVIQNDDIRRYMLLQHFAERGVDLSCFNGANLSDIHIMTCEINDVLPISDVTPNAGLVYKILPGARPVYIGQTYELPFDTDLSSRRLTFFDREKGVERYFYINRLFRHEVQRKMSDEQLDYVKREFEAAGVCADPLEFGLAAVEYEAEDDIQLQFYDKAYLDRNIKNNGSGSGFGFGPTTETGPHGLMLQRCALNEKYVPKDFRGNITLELLSYHTIDPEETVEL